MYLVGVGLAFLLTLTKVIDTLLNKKIVISGDPIKHSMNRIIIVMPILLVFALGNWHLEREAWWWILFYSLFECFNILFHQSSLKYLKAYTADVISKSKVIMVLIISIGLGVSSFNWYVVIGTFIFFFGLILILDRFKSLEEKKSNFLGIVLQTLSVMCRSAKPFIIKMILMDQLASNEVVVFLSMPISLVIIWFVFRRKPSINKENFKLYIYQGFFVAASMLLMGYAVLYSSEITVSVIEAFSGGLLFIHSVVFLKEKSNIKRTVGVILSILGLILIVVF